MYYVTKLVKGRFKYWWSIRFACWYGVKFNASEVDIKAAK